MKSIWLLAAAGVLAGAGCSGKAPAARTALHCPTTAGDLRLAAADAGGQTCAYRGPDGSEAAVARLAVSGDLPAALQPIEDEVWAGRRGKAAMRVEATPGGGIKVSNRGEPPVVLPKSAYPVVRNDANDIFVGGVRIQGDPAFGIIRYEHAVRLRGERFGSPRGVIRGFIHNGEGLPGGYRTLAYEAAGPASGPVTVVVFRSRAHVDELPPAVRRLARDNGGV